MISTSLQKRAGAFVQRRRFQNAVRVAKPLPGLMMNMRSRNVVTMASSWGYPYKKNPDDSWWLHNESLRYEWKWHDDRKRPGSWKKGAQGDRLVDGPSGKSSDVWDCYSKRAGKPSDGKKTPEDCESDGRSSSPEKEFTSFSRNLPARAKMGIDLLANGERYMDLPHVYVILFGVDSSPTEGIYSLRSYNSTTGIHLETIICFERPEEAFRFCGLLEATMVHAPSVHTIEPIDLVTFCNDAGYSCRLEPNGSMCMPPEINVGITDWERSMRLREGRFKVLDEEPVIKRRNELPPFSGKPEDVPKHIQEINDSIAMEVDEAREMLERMLPDDDC